MINNQSQIQRILNRPFVTYAIIGITVIVYLLQISLGGSGNIRSLILLGAKVNPLIIVEGQWWRLITPVFLHIGLTHILFNLLIVYFLGRQLEGFFGHFQYFILYFASALMGNSFSFAFNSSISVGASTAVFGLFASTLALSRIYPNRYDFETLAKNYALLIALNFIFGILSTGVDNAGHLGGLVGGFTVTYLITKPSLYNHHTNKNRIIWACLYLGALAVVILIGYYQFFPINAFPFF